MKLRELLEEEVSRKDINDLEKFADRILKKYGVDIEFTKHFVDRMNDPRNSPEIKVSELQRFFKKIQKNKARNIINNPDIQAVLKDMSTNLNLPVVIKTKGNEIEVTNKTIMRKQNFKTQNCSTQSHTPLRASAVADNYMYSDLNILSKTLFLSTLC